MCDLCITRQEICLFEPWAQADQWKIRPNYVKTCLETVITATGPDSVAEITHGSPKGMWTWTVFNLCPSQELFLFWTPGQLINLDNRQVSVTASKPTLQRLLCGFSNCTLTWVGESSSCVSPLFLCISIRLVDHFPRMQLKSFLRWAPQIWKRKHANQITHTDIQKHHTSIYLKYFMLLKVSGMSNLISQ